jgi:hypothetical protein
MLQPKFWAAFKAHAYKAIPSRAVRWTLLYVPAFTALLLLSLRVIGGLDDLIAYVMESGTRSLPVLIGIALTYGMATALGWNIDNTERARLQRIVSGLDETGSQWGAFVILAGEMVSMLALLALVLAALIVWQG